MINAGCLRGKVAVQHSQGSAIYGTASQSKGTELNRDGRHSKGIAWRTDELIGEGRAGRSGAVEKRR